MFARDHSRRPVWIDTQGRHRVPIVRIVCRRGEFVLKLKRLEIKANKKIPKERYRRMVNAFLSQEEATSKS